MQSSMKCAFMQPRIWRNSNYYQTLSIFIFESKTSSAIAYCNVAHSVDFFKFRHMLFYLHLDVLKWISRNKSNIGTVDSGNNSIRRDSKKSCEIEIIFCVTFESLKSMSSRRTHYVHARTMEAAVNFTCSIFGLFSDIIKLFSLITHHHRFIHLRRRITRGFVFPLFHYWRFSLYSKKFDINNICPTCQLFRTKNMRTVVMHIFGTLMNAYNVVIKNGCHPYHTMVFVFVHFLPSSSSVVDNPTNVCCCCSSFSVFISCICKLVTTSFIAACNCWIVSYEFFLLYLYKP